MEVHQRILHVLLDFRNQEQVINEKSLEEVLADIPLSAKSFPKSLSVNLLSFSGALSSTLPSVSVHWMFSPLVVDD